MKNDLRKSQRKRRRRRSHADVENRINIYKMRKALVLISIFAAVIVTLFLINKKYTVKTVNVDGNVHYTDEQIADIVTKGRMGKSTIYLSIKYRNKEIKDVPFIETMSVTIEKPDTIRVTVYEKSLAGYVEYLGKYMYFDKDGVIAEVSDKEISGIPEVAGLEFDHVVLYEQLPVPDPKVFSEILSITHLMEKYELDADKIYFDKDYNVILYFDKVEADLGTEDNIDDKVAVLPEILTKLKGKEGSLDLTDYKDGNTITFTEKNDEQ